MLSGKNVSSDIMGKEIFFSFGPKNFRAIEKMLSGKNVLDDIMGKEQIK
jgi:hypothetical protein